MDKKAEFINEIESSLMEFSDFHGGQSGYTEINVNEDYTLREMKFKSGQFERVDFNYNDTELDQLKSKVSFEDQNGFFMYYKILWPDFSEWKAREFVVCL